MDVKCRVLGTVFFFRFNGCVQANTPFKGRWSGNDSNLSSTPSPHVNLNISILNDTIWKWPISLDGRNPAPPRMFENHVNHRINDTYQLVQDFFHQQSHGRKFQHSPGKCCRYSILKSSWVWSDCYVLLFELCSGLLLLWLFVYILNFWPEELETWDGRKSHNKMIISYNFNIFQHFEIENTYSNLTSVIANQISHGQPTDSSSQQFHHLFIGCVWTKTRWLSQICFYFPPYSAEWSNHLRRNVVNCFSCNVGGAPWRNDDALDNCSASGLGFMGGSLGVDVYGVMGLNKKNRTITVAMGWWWWWWWWWWWRRRLWNPFDT